MSKTYKILRIAHWNANGLQNHREEVKLFLYHNKIDILLVSETHFTAKTHFSIPGYSLSHTNHPDDRAHGGTAILVRTTIKYAEQPCYAKPEIQATIIQVQGQQRCINIASVYCPPRYNLKAQHYHSFFKLLEPCFIAGGDYNCKHTLWGSRLITTKGRELASIIQSQNYSFLSTGTPTYWPTDAHKLPDLLDFFVTSKVPLSTIDIQPSYDLSSDHTPIIATLSTSIHKRQTKPRLHNDYTNWQTYKMEISSRMHGDWKLKTCDDLELATARFARILQQAADLATPKRPPPKPAPGIPSTIKRLVALKRKAKATWQKTHAPTDRRLYNHASRTLKTALYKLKNDTFTDYVSKLKSSDHSLWNSIKSRTKPTQPKLPIRNTSAPPSPWAKSDEEKADLFARHLTEVFTPHDDSPDHDVETQILHLNAAHEKLPAFTMKELMPVIKRLHPHKAPGLDNITAKMIQELPPSGLTILLYILNATLRLEYWPKNYKIARVIMVPKPAKPPTDVTSYRPISLLPVTSKILERLLLHRLGTDVRPHEWIPEHQFGFRKAHTTIQQCHRLADNINQALEAREYCTAVFLDISQAFDKCGIRGSY